MLRCGKVENPNDLVIKLGIPFLRAKTVWNKVMENEKLVSATIQREGEASSWSFRWF